MSKFSDLVAALQKYDDDELDAARDMADKVMELYLPYAADPRFVMTSLIHAMTRVMSLLPPERDADMLNVLHASVQAGLPVMRKISAVAEEAEYLDALEAGDRDGQHRH